MVTPNTTPYKPSPLSFGSPRTSPFRRPSVAAPNTGIRPNTPGSPGSKGPTTPVQSPSKLKQSHIAEDGSVFSDSQISPLDSVRREITSSPTRASHRQNESTSSMMGSKLPERSVANGDTLSRLPQAQLREMREAFQVLDRDNDGKVNREDVADILLNLGRQDSSSAATSLYFPSGGPQTLNLHTYLNSIANLLAPLSSPQELLNAFAAFDEDDSGQIDMDELRDALLNTSPDADEIPLTEREVREVVNGFTGRRAFGAKGAEPGGFGGAGKRSEVFRYQEFVESLTGGTAIASGVGQGHDNKRDNE
ncbi:calmodulin [Blastomyces dermatitidis ATCC 18188]|uniref:Calmodulin n=1 Tax=Ajellomyces dermatitidis (strain ATCC 18188 / CBS 674.68) TaxID=653446 RepID=F2TNB4_AJEDA|nr:calmodulin [Blastomyces dermatitidis ATCC 18188]